MSNTLPATPPSAFLELGYNAHQWAVLTRHFFPSAQSAETVLLVAQYCRARKLDLMSRPFHVVPMYDRRTQTYRDQILPSITLYLIQAHRTGEWAGSDPAVYGPEQQFTHGEYRCTVPESATVTVYRRRNGHRDGYTATAWYLESVRCNRDGQPNEIWRQSPRMMLAKCALAAALRMAFPEECGPDHTVEEGGASIAVEITPPPPVGRTPDDSVDIAPSPPAETPQPATRQSTRKREQATTAAMPQIDIPDLF